VGPEVTADQSATTATSDPRERDEASDKRTTGRASASDGVPIVAVKRLAKTFASRTVLRNVYLAIHVGEIHGLLGQNGSGKSTLIKILSGYHRPDDGASFVVRGEDVSLPLRPGDPRRLGIAFVHQDLGLVDDASVLENLRVGRYATGLGWRISLRREREIVRDALDRFGVKVSPDDVISSIAGVDRAKIAILRALEDLPDGESGLLVLDEPTAYLPRDGVEELFDVVRGVARQGHGVLFVSHRMDEVRAITSNVSILRDGVLVDSAPTASLSDRDIVSRILGFSLEAFYPAPHKAHDSRVVGVRHLSTQTVRDVSFDLHRGEILGLTGLIGMGAGEVPYALFGARPARTGVLEMHDRSYDLTTFSPRDALAAKMALLPANRLRDGGVAEASVLENVTLPNLPLQFVRGRLRRTKEMREASKLLAAFGVQPPDPLESFGNLSGGNQQKALIGKWFGIEPEVFLLDEPTQGVDVGARRQIFQHIRDAAARGTSFLVSSSEPEDLAHLCDRVLIFRHGGVASELQGAALTEARVVEQCFLATTT
jgi:ribose transport system ATP-binding protein